MGTKIKEQKFQKSRNKSKKKIWEQKLQKSGNKNLKNMGTKIPKI
jgi:hypothetical protein